MKSKSNQNIAQAKQINSMPVLYPNSAGIDIGSKSHYVAVPADRDVQCVREFSSFTVDLHRMVEWLKTCAIDTVVIESTGVFWISVFEILDQNGFDVKLVNARNVKNVSAHKTDVLDCQWLQQLASFGLLRGAFRPKDEIVELRAYLRQRDSLIKGASEHIQHMQKALTQMNIQLQNVLSDITGTTGMAIIRSIMKGERNPKTLAALRDGRCHNSEEIIMKSLEGNYRKEHVFALKQALALYDFYSQMISECDTEIMSRVQRLESQPTKISQAVTEPIRSRRKKLRKHEYPQEMGNELIRITGVDLRTLPGINVSTGLSIISEIGIDMSHWRSAKHFCSWLGLSPGNKVSGGKRLSGKTKPCANRAAILFRLSANTLYNSECALGAYLRRMKMRLGSPKAITACAHKLARQFYFMMKRGQDYVEKGAEYYEKKYRERKEKSLRRQAKALGFELMPISQTA